MSEESRNVNPAVDLALETIIRAMGLLPRRLVMEVGGALTSGMRWALPRKRRAAADSARLCDVADPGRFYARASRELGRTTFELIWLLAHPEEPAATGVEVEGLDGLQKAVAEGRGVLLVSGHFATWDFVGPAAALSGAEVAGTARTWRFHRLERRLITLRERSGVKTLIRGERGTGVAAYRWLKKGGIYCCMMDRISAGRRILVPFIGKGLYVPTGPAEMAVRSGAAVVFGFATRNANGSARVSFRRLDGADYTDPESLCTRIGREIESHLLAWPEQWFWTFRRNPSWPAKT